MSYQPKVSNVQKYEDSQVNCVVATAKLFLIEYFNKDLRVKDHSIRLVNDNDREVIPILISERENIRAGDKVWNENKNKLHSWDIEPVSAGTISSYKVLALPEHFSDKHLQAIVDGKMEDGDEVLVKCEDAFNETQGEIDGYYIHLDENNHITLFPAKQSLEEACEEFLIENYEEPCNPGTPLQWDYNVHTMRHAFKAGVEWAKKNNY